MRCSCSDTIPVPCEVHPPGDDTIELATYLFPHIKDIATLGAVLIKAYRIGFDEGADSVLKKVITTYPNSADKIS